MRPPVLKEPYARPVRFLELWHESGWALKVYGIAYQRGRPRTEFVETAKAVARERVLPTGAAPTSSSWITGSTKTSCTTTCTFHPRTIPAH